MKLEFCNEEAVDKAKHRADRDDGQKHHPKRHNAEIREELVGVGRYLEQRTGNTCGKTYRTTCGNIRTGEYDRAADTECDRQLCRRK